VDEVCDYLVKDHLFVYAPPRDPHGRPDRVVILEFSSPRRREAYLETGGLTVGVEPLEPTQVHYESSIADALKRVDELWADWRAFHRHGRKREDGGDMGKDVAPLRPGEPSPGPWQWEKPVRESHGSGSAYVLFAPGTDPEKCPARKAVIFAEDDFLNVFWQNDADARLIARAPEMLALLREIRGTLSDDLLGRRIDRVLREVTDGQ